MAARTAPIAKAMAMVRSTLTPMRRAVSGSCDTASMARPCLVRLMKSHRATEHTIRQPMMNSVGRPTLMPDTLNGWPVTMSIPGKRQRTLASGKPGTRP